LRRYILSEVILLLCGALLSGIIKGSIGIGSGLVPVALLAIFMPPDQVVVLLYPAMLATTIFSLVPYWKKWDVKSLKILGPLSILGTWIGVSVLAYSSPEILRILVGTVAILFVLNEYYKSRKNNEPETIKHYKLIGTSAGFIGGMMSALIHSGGVIFSMFLIKLKLPKESFVATLIMMMTINDICKGILYGNANLIDFSNLYVLLFVGVFSIVGVGIGVYLCKYIPVKYFNLIIRYVLLFSGIMLFVSGIKNFF
jgi:uncharacterized membrane protein YfcA